MAGKKAIFWTVKLWYGVMVLLLIALNAMSAGGVEILVVFFLAGVGAAPLVC